MIPTPMPAGRRLQPESASAGSRSPDLAEAISVQNWAKQLVPHPAILHSFSYVGKILPLSQKEAPHPQPSPLQ